jgi:hypothetical protein
MMKWCLSMLMLAAMLTGTVMAAAQEQQPSGRGQRGEQRGQAAARGNILQMLTAAGVKLTEE